MFPKDVFCKRCSCCICHEFDDNKDPSLWLTCDWDTDSCSEGDEPCGMSCHLNCALHHQRSGLTTNGHYPKLDGGFYCVSCGKVNRLMRTWRKQLVFANEARRVDGLCLRVSLSRKILEGSVKYQKLLKIVETAAKILENEVGPIDLYSDRRLLVNRLSCSTEVQNLCTSAIQAFDSSCSNSNQFPSNQLPTCRISFEEMSPTSVTIVLDYDPHLFEDFLGCRIYHRISTLKTYPKEATYIVLNPEKRFKLTNLDPSTDYSCLVSFFSNKKVLGFWESKWSTTQMAANTQTDSTTDFPCTPCKSDGTTKVGEVKKNAYEYAVGVIRSLEHNGHLSKDFRVKFLTWFSLKATMQQRRIVNVFVDALIDDPPCLAEQLLHTFTDEIVKVRERMV